MTPQQRSEGIVLEAGRTYWFEILHRSRNDSSYHVTAAWLRPGGGKPEVIPAEFLHSWVPDPQDLDDNGLADEWQERFGLPGGRGSNLVPFRSDGLTPPVVFAHSGNPKEPRALEGVMGWTRFYPVEQAKGPDFDILKFTESKGVDRAPDSTGVTPLPGMRLPSGRGGEVAVLDRLHGHLTPDQGGLYTFWVVGQGSAYLGLSGDSGAAGVAPLINMTRNRGFDHLGGGLTAGRSVPVWLEAGELRFIEACFAPELTARRLHVCWFRHEPPVWLDGGLGGTSRGTWMDAAPRMTAKVDGRLHFGGNSGDDVAYRATDAAGETETVGRVVGLRGMDPSAGGGLMIRAGSDAFAPFVAVTLGADRQLGFHVRSKQGGPEVMKFSRPYRGARFRLEDAVWLRLRHAAGECSALWSADGVAWQSLGKIRVDLGSAPISGPIAWGGSVAKPVEVGFSHVAVSPCAPGVPIPPGNLATAGVAADDQDADGLPDSWERRHALDSQSGYGDEGPWGDPDGDGVGNLEEFRRDGHPRQAGGFPASLSREYWRLIRGREVVDLTSSSGYREKPDIRDLIGQVDLQGGSGDFNYGQRIRGTLSVPVSGTYRFWASACGSCSVHLAPGPGRMGIREIIRIRGMDGEQIRPGEWSRYPSQRSGGIELEAGTTYFIEILHKAGTGGSHLALAWDYLTPDGIRQEREMVPASAFQSHRPDRSDLDDDGLPDEWERSHGLDPADSGHIDPLRQGAAGDFDGDGLNNLEEFSLGTHPADPHSDSDGVTDFDEVRLYGTDPLVADIDAPKESHRIDLAGSVPVGGSHPWIVDGGGALVSGARNGVVEFRFDVIEPGFHALVLRAEARGTGGTVPFSIAMDGRILGSGHLGYLAKTNTWITPWLSAGAHTVTVHNRNTRANAVLAIHGVSLSHFGGVQSDVASHPEWLKRYLATHNRFNPPAISLVSPAFVEGTTRIADSVRLSSDGREIEVHEPIAGRWYANVPLDSARSTTVIEAGFEGAAAPLRHNIEWGAMNLLDVAEDQHVRLGDSVKVAAWNADGTLGFAISAGERTWKGAPGSDPLIVKFENAGVEEWIVTPSAGEPRTVRFHVHEADLGAGFSVANGSGRKWRAPKLPQPLELEMDPALEAIDIEADRGDPAAREFLIRSHSEVPGALGMVARLPGGGPILASTQVAAFNLSSASDTTDARQVETLPDGTRVVRVSYRIDGAVPPDLSIWIRLYVGDAVFTNGLVWRELTATDFNDQGVAEFDVLKAPGKGTPFVCHWILPQGSMEDVLKLRPVP